MAIIPASLLLLLLRLFRSLPAVILTGFAVSVSRPSPCSVYRIPQTETTFHSCLAQHRKTDLRNVLAKLAVTRVLLHRLQFRCTHHTYIHTYAHYFHYFPSTQPLPTDVHARYYLHCKQCNCICPVGSNAKTVTSHATQTSLPP